MLAGGSLGIYLTCRFMLCDRLFFCLLLMMSQNSADPLFILSWWKCALLYPSRPHMYHPRPLIT